MWMVYTRWLLLNGFSAGCFVRGCCAGTSPKHPPTIKPVHAWLLSRRKHRAQLLSLQRNYQKVKEVLTKLQRGYDEAIGKLQIGYY